MSAARPANMRGPRVKSPLLLLLLLLVLITLTGTALCQSEGDDAEPEAEAPEEEAGDLEPTVTTETTELPPDVSDAPSPPDPSPTDDQITEDIDRDGSGTGLTQIGESTSAGTELPGTIDNPIIEENLGLIIVPVLVVLVVVIISVIVCGIFISRKWNNNKRNQELRKADPYLDGSSTEKVPMPMFEEDVPSVLELEMEELDQWMSKDGEPAEDSNHA